jgi:hypothetical protein
MKYVATLKTSHEIAAEIVEQCLSELTPKDIEALKEHPRSWEHHFGYGLYIRNKYLWHREDVWCADSVSSEVIRAILARVVPGYDPDIDDVTDGNHEQEEQ